MTVNRTTLLNLPLPVTGTESGLWGDYTNNGLTEYVDTAVAGALSITASVTLANSTGTNSSTGITTTTAQYRTLIVPASGPSANVVITAPSSNRTYHVINRNATYTVQIRAGANTGVTLSAGQSATVAYDSVAGDYVLVGPIGPTVPVARGGTGATTLTGIVKGNGTSAFTAAVSGTDYAPATSGTSILYGNGSGGFSNVAIGSGISFAGGTLSATGSGGSVTSVGMSVPAFLSVAGSPITSSGTLAVSYSGTALPVANGGTGATTLTANNVLLGNGTSALQVVAPGSSGNVLTSDGTTWQSTAPTASSGSLYSVAYTTSGTFTVPTGVTRVYVEVFGGGGGAATASGTAAGGGGYCAGTLTVTPGNSITVTVGSGGAGGQAYGGTGNTGGTSSFSTMTANGGTGSGSNNNGAGGSASGGSIWNFAGTPGNPWQNGNVNSAIPGYAGFIVSSAQLQRGPGSGGYSYGNVSGTSGNAGQVNIWYVGP